MTNTRRSLQTSRVTIRRAFAEHGDEACIGGFNVHKVTIEHGVMLRVLFDASLRHEQPQYFDQSFRACFTSVRLDSPDRATRHTERYTATSRATHKDPVIHTRDTLEEQYLCCSRMKKKKVCTTQMSPSGRRPRPSRLRRRCCARCTGK